MAASTAIHLLTHEFFPYKGGAATFCREIAAAAAVGQPVHVWGPRYCSADPSLSFAVHPLPMRGRLDLLDQITLIRSLRRQLRPCFQAGDILHLAEPGPVAAAARFPGAFRFARERLILTLHGSEILAHARNRARRRRFKKLLQAAATIHVLSAYNERLLQAHFPGMKRPVTVLPGGPRSFPTPPLRFPFPIGSENRFEILCVGRIHPRKGQWQLIDALAATPGTERQRLRIWLVGPIIDHAYFQRCTQRARAAGLETRFIHGCPDAMLPGFYRNADLATMTSITRKHSIEGFGLANLEAASFGLPVVAHDSGGIRETIIDGQTGILVPTDQPAKLRDAIIGLARDARARQDMAAAARSFASRFSWEQTARQLYT